MTPAEHRWDADHHLIECLPLDALSRDGNGRIPDIRWRCVDCGTWLSVVSDGAERRVVNFGVRQRRVPGGEWEIVGTPRQDFLNWMKKMETLREGLDFLENRPQ